MAERTRDDEQGRDADDGSRGPVDEERPALPAADDWPALAADDWPALAAGDEPPILAAGDEPPILAAEVVVSRDRPAECTIYPFVAPDHRQVVRWITATEGSFVALDEMR